MDYVHFVANRAALHLTFYRIIDDLRQSYQVCLKEFLVASLACANSLHLVLQPDHLAGLDPQGLGCYVGYSLPQNGINESA